MQNKHILFLILSICLVYLWAGWGIGFDSDCFGFVSYVAKIKTIPQLWQALIGQIQFAYMPLNEQPQEMSTHFFTYYRPLGTLVYYLCYQLFGIWAYGWYCMQILFHALTSVCLYSMFSYLITPVYAFFFTLLFAFHPVMAPHFIGLICCVIPVFSLLALAVVLYAQYVKSNKKIILICSSLAYVLSLYAYEQPIIFLMILFLYLMLFRIKYIIHDCIPYSIVTVFYLVSRYMVLGGLPKKTLTSPISMIDMGMKAVGNWVATIRLFFGFELINRAVSIILIVFFVLGICYICIRKLYYQVDRRRHILFYIASFFLASWPLFTQGPCPRYLIAALPFFLLLLYELYERNVRYCIVIIGIVWGAIHGSIHLSRRAAYTYKRDEGLQEVAYRYAPLHDKTLVILGTLSLYNNTHFLMHSGMMQALHLFCKDPGLKVYHVTQLMFIASSDTQDNFSIEPIDKGYRFVTSVDNNLFLLTHKFGNQCALQSTSMGDMTVHARKNNWQSYDVSYTFDDQWLTLLRSPQTIVLSWDVMSWRFVELDKTHVVHA